jgi:Ca2+-transporting ATPase
MLFAGTTIASGRGRAAVVATGPATEMARIRALVERTRQPPTTLERRVDDLGRKATAASAAAGGLAALAGIAHGRGAAAVVRSGVALGVAAMPEGLPLVVTATLVRATRRMRKHGMVVRRLGAIETLGGVTVVCADKTGTLTRNEMQLEILELAGESAPLPLVARPGDDPLARAGTAALAAAILNSDLEVHNGNGVLNVLGSSTERAFVEAARQAGMDVEAILRRYPRRLLRERDDRFHYVTSLHDAPGGGRIAFVKGAPEQVLSLCAEEAGQPIDAGARGRLLARNDALAADGLRVLALALRKLPPDADLPADGFTLLGLAGLRDPLRVGAAAALQDAARARIRTLVLTGDQRATAAAIARAAGLEGRALEWSEIVGELRAGGDGALEGVSVVARVAPADKLQIVEALRRGGEVVAMAGDGINDAPALRAADVGIAVSARATDVARQTADVVLAGDDLRAILAAIGEGRIVQDNLKRAVRYLAATNLSEIALVLSGSILGVEPISPLQLLWVNLLTDTLPALALALEPGRPEALDREPTPPGSPIVDRAEWPRIGLDAVTLAGVGGVAYLLGGPAAAFGALPASQLAYAWRCRAPGAPLSGRFVALVAGSTALHAGSLLFPPLAGVLRLPWAPGAALAGFAAGLAAGLILPPSGRAVRAAAPERAAAEPADGRLLALPDSITGVLGRDAFVVAGRGAAIASPASTGG